MSKGKHACQKITIINYIFKIIVGIQFHTRFFKPLERQFVKKFSSGTAPKRFELATLIKNSQWNCISELFKASVCGSLQALEPYQNNVGFSSE
jgi:hypothetical protein